MSVLMRMHIPHMPEEAYLASREHVEPALAATPACHSHVAVAEDGGLTVFEVWDDADAWRTFFDAVIRPVLPPGTEPNPTFLPVLGFDVLTAAPV
ncbi:MAG: hypothetical protein JWN17_852 [Frankiales bacterium]|nr:hypothetical protein [Frankiales bacterium]